MLIRIYSCRLGAPAARSRHGYSVEPGGRWQNKRGLIGHLPKRIEFHLKAQCEVAESQVISVNWEIGHIQKALDWIGNPVRVT